MNKMKGLNWKRGAAVFAVSLMMVLTLGVSVQRFSIVSHAQSQGKVTAASAKIRKDANTSSEVVGSASKDASVTINNQVTASDGTVWYQVFVNANTLGYIRSDLVEITDGTTPPAASQTTTQTTTDTTQTDTTTQTTTNETPAFVTAVEPMSATVIGGQAVRVRSNASTTSQIVTTANNGVALTVNGQADGSDGKVWYQVSFISNGQDVTGFIRSDYVQLSGELVPATGGAAEDGAETPAEDGGAAEPETPSASKDWETQYDADQWYLVDNLNSKRYKISEIFDIANNYYPTVLEQKQAADATAKSQKIIIIILVFLLVGAAGGITVLIFKLRDINDARYFEDVERETARRRVADRPENVNRRVMHDVGAPGRTAGARPSNVRTAGNSGAGKPSNSNEGTGRPVNRTARPADGRAVNQTARPADGRAVNQTARPADGRPVNQAARPAENASVAGQTPGRTNRPVRRPAQETPASQGRRPVANPQAGAGRAEQKQGWQSKNFMTDDDEFEFEFLNWDGDDEQ